MALPKVVQQFGSDLASFESHVRQLNEDELSAEIQSLSDWVSDRRIPRKREEYDKVMDYLAIIGKEHQRRDTRHRENQHLAEMTLAVVLVIACIAAAIATISPLFFL